MLKSSDVLFEDNHLLVLKKPANLPTQPTPKSEESLELWGKAWLKAKYQKQGQVFLHAIHRLDGPVSGIVVLAKTSKALSRLQAEIRNKTTKKTYVAWVEGALPDDGSLEDYLIHGDHIAKKASPQDKLAKLCRLKYRILKKKPNQTLVEIDLETGRYHQIRAQFALFGHPVIGDKKYGSASKFDPGIALHHASFSIPHPITKEMITFTSNPEFKLQE